MDTKEAKSRLATRKERLEELQAVKRLHWTKRPEKWQGSEGTRKLNAEIDRLEGEVLELNRMIEGGWTA
jgi:hypothetical protein